MKNAYSIISYVSLSLLAMYGTVQAQEGYYQTITNVASGLVLEVDGNLSGSNVQVGSDVGAFNQRWHVFSVASGEYFIRSVQSGYRALDCYNWGTANGTNIITWDYAGGNNQIFQIVPVGTYYKIVTKQNLNQCLDAAGTTDGSNVRLWSYSGAANQLWTLSGDGRGASITLQPGQDIQTAIEQYRTVNLAQGSWTINSTINLHAGLTLEGSGMYQTILKGPDTEYSHVFFGNPYVGPLTDVTIKNLKCDGNANDVYGNHCINPQDPINMHVENVYIVDFRGMGVSTGGSVNCYYNNVVCDGCGQAHFDPGWHNWYSRRITGDVITNCVCKNSPHGDGMKLSIGSGWTINNCTFYGNYRDGMCTQDINYTVTITGSTAFDNGWGNDSPFVKGFYIYSNDGSLMENCTVYHNYNGNGIYTGSNADGAGSTVRNCTVFTNHPTWPAVEVHGGWSWDGKLSVPDTTHPAAPMNITAIVGSGSVALDWEDNVEVDSASYSVYRSMTKVGGYSLIASDLATSAYTDHTVAGGTTYYYVMTATDMSSNESTNSGWISAAVTAGNTAPVFTSDPINNIGAIELSSYSGTSLANYANDVDGMNTITFNKVSGPGWLSVASDGTLSGIPLNANVGVNTLIVGVTDTGGLSDTATMNITVANIYSGVDGLDDLLGLAAQWLMSGCTDIPACNGADLDGDNDVDLADFSELAIHWLTDETLQLYLKLDETSGSAAADASFYSRPGLLVNNPVWSAEGKTGGSLSFDGMDDYVEISSYQGITGTTSRSCCAWVKTTSTAQRAILSWGGEQYGQRWIFRVEANGTLAVVVGGGYVSTATTVNNGQWHHVAAVLTDDGSPSVTEILLYIDGVLQSTSASSSQAIGTLASQAVIIGAYKNAGVAVGFFNGLIDEVRIYNRVLTTPEIAAIDNGS